MTIPVVLVLAVVTQALLIYRPGSYGALVLAWFSILAVLVMGGR